MQSKSARFVRRLASVMVFPVALVGCGGATASANHSTMPSTITSTTPATGQILSAWLAAERAFHDAALTSNPDEPALKATMMSPQLDGARSALARLRAAGDVAKGETGYGSPRLVSSISDKGTVVSCIDEAEVEVSDRTGQPVPGVLGEADFELVTSTMRLTSNGWKLASQTVEEGKCSASERY